MKTLLCILGLFAVGLAAPGLPGGRILGGVDAERGQFPYMVSLHYCIGTTCQHACGGSILSPSWIVTAAHCFTDVPSVGSYSVLAGVLNLNDTNIEKELVSVLYSYIHPKYEGGAFPNDIALIRLVAPLTFNELVQPVTLPPPGQEFNGRFTLSGWGSTGGTNVPIMPNTAQTIDIPLVPSHDCQVALDTVLEGRKHPFDAKTNICTGPLSGGISTCLGDSGGPLVKVDLLVGVVSWGITPCGTYGAPSVYVKVSHYIDWISEHVDEPLRFK